jgi:hypothetical protein
MGFQSQRLLALGPENYYSKLPKPEIIALGKKKNYYYNPLSIYVPRIGQYYGISLL